MTEDAAVGYKRPPVNRRFTKKYPGNPGGRLKGSRNFSSIMGDVLNEEMRVRIEGRQVVVTGRHALGLVMVRRAVSGDVRMIQLLLKYRFFDGSDEPIIFLLSESDLRL